LYREQLPELTWGRVIYNEIMPVIERGDRPRVESPTAAPVSADLAATEKKIQEIENWLAKLEAGLKNQSTTQTHQPTQPSDDGDDLSIIAPQKRSEPIILPLTKTQIEAGLHKPITSSLHWLAEWSIRMIKMYHNRVLYPAAA